MRKGACFFPHTHWKLQRRSSAIYDCPPWLFTLYIPLCDKISLGRPIVNEKATLDSFQCHPPPLGSGVNLSKSAKIPPHHAYSHVIAMQVFLLTTTLCSERGTLASRDCGAAAGWRCRWGGKSVGVGWHDGCMVLHGATLRPGLTTKHQHDLHPTNQLKPQNSASIWAELASCKQTTYQHFLGCQLLSKSKTAQKSHNDGSVQKCYSTVNRLQPDVWPQPLAVENIGVLDDLL